MSASHSKEAAKGHLPARHGVVNNGGGLDVWAVGHGPISTETAQVIPDKTNRVAAAGREDVTTSSCWH